MVDQRDGLSVIKYGAIFLAVIAIIPGIVLALTGVNMFFDPYDYNQAIQPNSEGITCVEAVGGYNPDNNQERMECSAVATVGLQQANQIYGFISGLWIALVVVGIIAVIAGFITYKFA